MFFKSTKVKTKCLALCCVLFFIIVSSCSYFEDRTKDKLTGNWAIEDIEYQGKDCKDSIFYNLLGLKAKERNKYFIALIPGSIELDYDNSFWYVYQGDNGMRLKIESPNYIFNGDYEIKFFKNHERRLLGVELTSGSSKIIGYKTGQGFDDDGFNWE